MRHEVFMRKKAAELEQAGKEAYGNVIIED